MIEFSSPSKLVQFLEENLPPKIREELFYDSYSREYRGKTIIDKTKKSNFFIFDELRSINFATGITTDPNSTFIPEKYILFWTKLHEFIQSNSILNIDPKRYSLLSINEACEFLSVTRPTLYKIIRQGRIPIVQVLSQKRIQLKDLLDFIEKNRSVKAVSG